MKRFHYSWFLPLLLFGTLALGGEQTAWAQNTFPSSGNVGIGTTSPTRPLHVVGDFRATGNIRSGDTIIIDTGRRLVTANGTAGTPAYRFSAESGIGMYRAGTADLRFSTGSSTRLQITSSYIRSYLRHRFVDGTAAAPALTFASDTDTGLWRVTSNVLGFSTGGSERMRIDASGNVGIGTDSPTAKLAVNGVMKTKEIIVTDQAGDWPDYVFSPGYELMSLDELELFVYANRHLPGIHEQAQTEREGQNVGEIQRMLLEKVEELTLHVIAMKKENERLEQQRALLAEKLSASQSSPHTEEK